MKGKGANENEDQCKRNETQELEMDELEQVNAGSVLAGIALAAACVSLVVETAKLGRKIYNDLTK